MDPNFGFKRKVLVEKVILKKKQWRQRVIFLKVNINKIYNFYNDSYTTMPNQYHRKQLKALIYSYRNNIFAR